MVLCTKVLARVLGRVEARGGVPQQCNLNMHSRARALVPVFFRHVAGVARVCVCPDTTADTSYLQNGSGACTSAPHDVAALETHAYPTAWLPGWTCTRGDVWW